jgi:hypothetical protein
MSHTLVHIASGTKSISIQEINTGTEKGLANEIQSILCQLGLLDPVITGDKTTPFKPTALSDGYLGLNTRNAIALFCKLRIISYPSAYITPALAKALLAAKGTDMLPIVTRTRTTDLKQTKLAKKLVIYMQKKGYWIARAPDMVNIIYAEGMDSDGDKNSDQPNKWNDRRMVFRIRPGGHPQMLLNYEATTEPGSFYVEYPLNSNGAARMAFGQYKAWIDGYHNGTQPALVQRGDVRVHRDKNKDGKRSASDPMDVGDDFGINQHSTSPSFDKDEIDRYSAGCLVGRNYDEHLKFLATVRKDPRYIMNKSYLFVAAVIAGDDFDKLT